MNHVDLVAVTSFSSHLPFGWKKVIKVFPILEAIHSNAYPMILLPFLFGHLEKGGEPKKQNNILDLK